MKINSSNMNDLQRLAKLTLIYKKSALNSLGLFKETANKLGINESKAKAQVMAEILHRDESENAINLAQGIPAVVNMALAIECALKARSIVDHGTFPKDHDIEKLYNIIPKNIQDSITQRICNTLGITEGEFDVKLKSNKDHFVGMRYMESTTQELTADFEFLLALLNEFTPLIS